MGNESVSQEETQDWLSGMTYLASGIRRRHRPPQTLGAVDNDDTSISGLLQLLQQVSTVVGGISAAIRLQDDALHGRLQESPHLHTQTETYFFWPIELADQLGRIKNEELVFYVTLQTPSPYTHPWSQPLP